MALLADTTFYYERTFYSDSSRILLAETFEIKEPIFDKENHAAVKEFFTRAYALMEEEIVLKKKK